MLKEPHEIWKLLPKKDWPERQEYITRLTSYPVVEYRAELEQGIRNDDDADVRNAAMEVYRVLGMKGFTSLEVLLQDHNHEVRLFVVNILCSIADRGTFPLLAEAINDSDVNVRIAAAEALGKIRDERAVPLLEDAINDEPWVAMAAIDALGQIGGEAALRVLYRCLEIPDLQEYAVAVLLQFVEDSDAEVRTEVALAFGSVALPRAVRILECMLHDPDEEVRVTARRSLDSRGKEVGS